jgi:plastocyanin
LRIRTLAAAAAILAVAPATAAADTATVGVGGAVAGKPQIDLQGFYPGVASIHVGDTVHLAFGSFHAVHVLPNGVPALPLIVPVGGTFAPQNDAAGNPFWWGGAVPALQINPDVAAPSASAVFDGTTPIGTGLPTGFPFAKDVSFTTAGTFRLVCDLHPQMQGLVRVLPAGAPIPSAERQAARGARQLARDARHAVALDARLSADHGDRHSKRDDDHRGARRAIAGTGTSRFSLNAFYPASAKVRVGQSITWSWLGVNEVHTLTFGPEAVIAPIEQTLLGGPGGPTLNPLGALPTEPPGAPVVHSTNVHGDGLLGSGIVRDNPGGPPNTFTVKFTEAGTFTFDCLIHNGMSGTVTVTN